MDEAIRRGNAYKAAGADFIFVEAPESIDELRAIARGVKAPVVLNNIEGGRTPILTLEEICDLGFISVGFVLTGLFAAARALEDAYRHLLAHGGSTRIRDRMMDFDEFAAVMDLEETYALDERFKAANQ